MIEAQLHRARAAQALGKPEIVREASEALSKVAAGEVSEDAIGREKVGMARCAVPARKAKLRAERVWLDIAPRTFVSVV